MDLETKVVCVFACVIKTSDIKCINKGCSETNLSSKLEIKKNANLETH